MLVSFIFTWQKDTDRLREREFFSFKSRARWHASSVASLLPAVIFMTHDVIGQPCFWEGQRVRPHTNGHTAVLFIPLAVSPLSDLKYRLTCLALGLYWHVFSSVYTQLSVCSFPVWYLTFTQSFTSFTHFFTHDYNVFLFCFSTPSLIPFTFAGYKLLKKLTEELIGCPYMRWVWMRPLTVCLIVGAIVWGTWKEWGQLFTQMVYWWRCEAGQLTVGTQRLLFLVSLTVFKTTVFFSP